MIKSCALLYNIIVVMNIVIVCMHEHVTITLLYRQTIITQEYPCCLRLYTLVVLADKSLN